VKTFINKHTYDKCNTKRDEYTTPIACNNWYNQHNTANTSSKYNERLKARHPAAAYIIRISKNKIINLAVIKLK
jgi:hypothetical protein